MQVFPSVSHTAQAQTVAVMLWCKENNISKSICDCVVYMLSILHILVYTEVESLFGILQLWELSFLTEGCAIVAQLETSICPSRSKFYW